MRITFVIPYFYPAWQYGGTPRAAFELARALTRRNHQVQVLTTDSGGRARLPLDRMDREWKDALDGMEVLYYRNSSNVLAYGSRLFWPRQLFKEISTKIRTSDVVHIHEFRSTLSVPAFYAARSLGIPYVISPHGGLKHHGRAMLKTSFDFLFGKRMLAEAAAVIALSEVDIDDAKRFNTRNSIIHHVPNPVDFAAFAALPERGRFRSRHALGSGKFLLFLGRLNWIKGADILLRALPKITNDDFRIVIAGPDEGQERQLRHLVSELRLNGRVTLTDYLNVQQKLEAFVDCNLVVVPSRSEGFPVSVLEALLAGSPVLLSSACGLSPLLEQGCGVVRFKSGDTQDLARKLEMMLDDPTFAKDAAAARSVIAREFSPDAVAARTEAVYAACLRS